MDPTNDYSTSPNTTLDDEYESSYKEFWRIFNHNLKILNIVTTAIYSIIFILGIIGNGLVIWIAGFRMKKIISAVWFLHLAIADFLCCLSLPLRIVEWNDSNDVCYAILPEHFCTFNHFLFHLNMNTSVFLLTAMSIDRWVSVICPFWARTHRTPRLVRITAGIIWGLSLIWSGIMFFKLGWYGRYILYDFTTKLFRLYIMFLMPFCLILASYVTIFCTIRESNRPQRSQRPYRIITAVILCFFICWAPYYIWPLVEHYNRNALRTYTIENVVTFLVYLNSCINPIIYVFMGQDIRHRFLKSIPLRMENALSEHPDDPFRGREAHEQSPNREVSPC